MAPSRIRYQAKDVDETRSLCGMTMTKKTVILLCGPPTAAIGGGPTHIKNMLRSPLGERYNLIHFVSGSRGKESPANDELTLAKGFRFVTSPIALGWEILRFRPAVVHLNSVLDHKAFWRDFVYLLISKLLRRRVILQFHGGSLSAFDRTKLMRDVFRWALSIPEAIVLLAKSEKKNLEKLGISTNLTVIPNAVDIAEYRGRVERVHSGHVRRLVYMGRLVREKGMFEVMEAIKILSADQRFPGIEFRIAGSGPARQEIERWVSDHRLERHIKVIGPIYGKDKVDFLQQADVFVFPTYHPEGLPYSILESLAAGTPVIASKVAGIPDVVVDRVHGILIDAKDPRQIVDAVHELSRSEERLREMSRNCTVWATQQLGLERLAAQFGELYEKLRA